MTIENQQDLDGILKSGKVVSSVLHSMLAHIEPGMTTAELDDFGSRLLEQSGAQSAPRVMYDFPGATCISINEQAAHGIPGARVIQPNDVVNVDVSAVLDGYYADTGGTMVVPPGSVLKRRLCRATQTALAAALNQVRAGARINQIGLAAQKVARRNGFRIIRNLAGHGVGRSLHEEPESILGYHDPSDTRVLREGQVLAIEPFLSTHSTWVEEGDDGWTLVAQPGNLSAQFEHTVIVTRGQPIVATRN